MLVAIGLNVVVGQAGLLDLGYVGFFAVGAYTVGRARVRARQRAVADLRADRRGRGHALRAACSARPRCGCGATTWPSSRWASARSSGSPPRTPTGSAGADGITNMPQPARHRPRSSSACSTPRRTTGWRWSSSSSWSFLMRRLERSRVGRAWTAIREDEDAAELMGVPDVPVQAVGLRHRRGRRRPLGHALRRLRPGRHPGHLPAHPVDPVPGRGRARRRRATCRASSSAASSSPTCPSGSVVQSSASSSTEWRVFIFGVALDRHDDLPAPGHPAQPPAGRRAPETEHQADFPGLAGADIGEGLDLVGDPIGEGEP